MGLRKQPFILHLRSITNKKEKRVVCCIKTCQNTYMDTLSTFLIFVVVLFMYIHIMNQYKRSEELEIYETDYTTNLHMNDVCEIKQPVLFNIDAVVPALFQDITPQTMARFSSHDIRLKDVRDYYKTEDSVDSVLLPLHTTIQLIESDTTSFLFSENNYNFLDESGLLQKIQYLDGMLKPPMTVSSNYDIMFGSCNVSTPLRYHTDTRRYLCVTSGKIRVKMTPWKSSKYLHPYKDFENYEFRSMVHPESPSSEHASDFDKVNFIDFEVKQGYLLYIPSYWWYSITYLDEPSTFVCSVTYNTVINHLANMPDLLLYFLQQQNITKKVASSSTNLTLPSNPEPDVAVKQEVDDKQEVDVNDKDKQEVEIKDIKEDSDAKEQEKREEEEDEKKKLPNENITYSISNI